MRQDVSRYQRVDEALPPSEQLFAKGLAYLQHKGDRQIHPMGPGGEGVWEMTEDRSLLPGAILNERAARKSERRYVNAVIGGADPHISAVSWLKNF